MRKFLMAVSLVALSIGLFTLAALLGVLIVSGGFLHALVGVIILLLLGAGAVQAASFIVDALS